MIIEAAIMHLQPRHAAPPAATGRAQTVEIDPIDASLFYKLMFVSGVSTARSLISKRKPAENTGKTAIGLSVGSLTVGGTALVTGVVAPPMVPVVLSIGSTLTGGVAAATYWSIYRDSTVPAPSLPPDVLKEFNNYLIYDKPMRNGYEQLLRSGTEIFSLFKELATQLFSTAKSHPIRLERFASLLDILCDTVIPRATLSDLLWRLVTPGKLERAIERVNLSNRSELST